MFACLPHKAFILPLARCGMIFGQGGLCFCLALKTIEFFLDSAGAEESASNQEHGLKTGSRMVVLEDRIAVRNVIGTCHSRKKQGLGMFLFVTKAIWAMTSHISFNLRY